MDEVIANWKQFLRHMNHSTSRSVLEEQDEVDGQGVLENMNKTLAVRVLPPTTLGKGFLGKSLQIYFMLCIVSLKTLSSSAVGRRRRRRRYMYIYIQT